MDRYSRRVAILKVLLPLMALGLLSTLFLLSRSPDPEARIPFADREIADRLRDQQITAPVYAGTSANGEDFFVTAVKISPPIGDKPARAVDLEARLEGNRGQVLHMQAARGTFEDGSAYATFEEDVVITSTTGYVIHTQQLIAQLDGSHARSPGKVHGHGPAGQFSAGEMEISPKIDGDGMHIVFKNGVRLVYEPGDLER